MSKTYTIAGTSVLRGVRTYRFANGSAKVRAGVLKRNDHTEIELLDLPEPMEKTAAIQWLNAQGIDGTLPATGRGAAITPEEQAEIEAQAEADAQARAEAEAAQLAADADWIAQQAA